MSNTTKTDFDIGEQAPEFSVLNDQEQTVSLADFRGKNVVLYFYPKDSTPGCTREAQDFVAAANDFAKKNTVILGVSRDNVKSHCKFKEKYQINYALLADTDEKLCQLYDVIKDKNMYGKKVRGIERSTFLINPQGKLQKIWRKVKVDNHVSEVLAEIK